MAKLSNSVLDAVKLDPFNPNTTRETLINPDTVPSGATAKPVYDIATGTKDDPSAVRGRRANEPAPKPNLPQGRPGLREDQGKAAQTLKDLRSERDDFVESARQDKKSTKRAMREKSIIKSDDFDIFGDEDFSSTDPFIADLFQDGKINKLLKDQIKEQYPDQIAEITERVKNDPDNAGLSGKEIRKLINAEIKKFIEPKWKAAGGDTQVNKVGLITPVAAVIKKMFDGSAHESVTKVLNDKRAALEKKQNRSLKDQMFLDAFDFIEKDINTAEKTAELKGQVKDARNKLTDINAEVREHEKAVDRARSSFYKDSDKETKITHKGDWTYFDRGKAHYAARIEDRDGKKKYVVYSATEGSPDTDLDSVWEFDYQNYNGEENPNEKKALNYVEGDNNQVKGGNRGKYEKSQKERNEKNFKALDGQNYFTYREAHKFMAPKIMKIISDLGGKIDAKTGKIYTLSVADFPEGANELRLDYITAKRLAGKSDEDVARLTGMTPEEVKARQIIGMTRSYKLGDANVIEDEKGRLIYQLPDDNKTVLSSKQGRSFYINWNEPHNRKVAAEYIKQGKTKQDIPLNELKTVNISRSSEGNIDWADKAKTEAAEKTQRAQYTGSYKPSADVLNALIGFGRK